MPAGLPRLSARGVARTAAIIAVVIVALQVRLVAVDRLPIDFDEDDYLRAGQLYAEGIRAGDPGVVLRENYRAEHPPLTKLITGLALLPLPDVDVVPDRPTSAPSAESLPQPHLDVARTAQTVAGAVAVAALSVLSPLAGLYLAVHSWTIKYTSQVMLEAIPAALSMLAVFAYLRSGAGRSSESAAGRRRARRVWLIASAVAFGLACSSKYPYGVVGLAILADWAWSTRPSLRMDGGVPVNRGRWLVPLFAWSVAAIVVFFAANPYLWPDPIGRLGSSLAYHLGYAGSEEVTRTGWPSWQPLVWLFGSVPFHEPGTFPLTLDIVITVLAAIGVRRLWARQRVLAVWLLLGGLVLLVWPTKWPQYLLLISAPLAASAAHGTAIVVGEPLRARLDAWWTSRRRTAPATAFGLGSRLRGGLRDLGAAAPWLAPGLVAVVVLCLVPIAYELAMSVTDFQRTSIRDGINGGVLREAIGGVTGAITAQPFSIDRSDTSVHYVGPDLLAAFTGGVWLGGNTSAQFPAFSVLWMVLSVLLQTALGIGVALILARPGVRFGLLWRTLFILPWAIPEFVGAIAWRSIVHPDNGWLALLMGSQFGWPTNPDLALLVLLIAGTWAGWPLMMLVASAGLKTIPRGVGEAAALEGAGAFTRFRSVTLPLLLPLLAPALVIRGVAAFNQFYLFYVLLPPDPTITTATFSYFVFDSSGGPGLFAVSAAINVLTVVALGAVVVWFLRWRDRAERVAFY